MSAQIIDGKAVAASLRTRLAEEVAGLKTAHGLTPGLAAVLVGENPASQVYVRNKVAQTLEAGMNSFEIKRPADITEADLLALVHELNERADVHGILVQLPLPGHIAADKVLNAIRPEKDVDGFHPINAGLLAIGKPALAPCTPVGSVMLAKTAHETLRGKHVVVVGRSTIVGRPAAQLFLLEDCTVTIAHSATADLPGVCRLADILVVAVGRPEFVRGDWVKPGATVIDVGINRVPKPDGKGSRIVGDVAYAAAAEVAGAITPVPGGVGPMTIACLLSNTVRCARLLSGLL